MPFRDSQPKYCKELNTNEQFKVLSYPFLFVGDFAASFPLNKGDLKTEILVSLWKRQSVENTPQKLC